METANDVLRLEYPAAQEQWPDPAQPLAGGEIAWWRVAPGRHYRRPRMFDRSPSCACDPIDVEPGAILFRSEGASIVSVPC